MSVCVLCVSVVSDQKTDGSRHVSSLALTMLTIHLLTASHKLAPASDTNWFDKNRAMCCYVYVIMHAKDP